MSQHYSNPERESDDYALPDVETFYLTASDFINAEEGSWMADHMADPDADADSLAGWYYWFCFPGCLPDSEPYGPYPDEATALAAAREGNE